MSELHGGEPISPRLYKESEVASIKTARLSVGVFCALMAIALSICYVVVQPDVLRGFEQIRNSLNVSICLLLLPQGYRELREWLKLSPQLGVGVDAGVMLVGLIGLIGFSWLETYISVSFIPVFWVVALLLLSLSLRQFIPPKLGWRHFVVGAIALTFYAYIAWSVWGIGYLSPRPNAALLAGTIHLDTLFHSSVAAMIQTYGIPSTGLDGLIYLPYHTGSHWLFAQLAPLLNLSVFRFYNLAYPVLILPLLFSSLLTFAVDLRVFCRLTLLDWDLRKDWLFWGLLATGFIGYLPHPLLAQIRIGVLSTLISQSHLTALTLAFCILSLCLYFLTRLHEPISVLQKVLLVFSISLLLGLVTLCKVSVGFVLFGAIFYATLRLRMYREWIFCLGMGGAVALQIWAFKCMGYFGAYSTPNTPKQLFAYFYYVDPSVRVFWLPVLFLWTFIYICLRCQNANLKTIGDLIKAFDEGEMIDLEIIFVTCILGLLPGMFLNIAGGGAYYFMDFQMWLSLSLLLGTAYRLTEWKLGSTSFYLRLKG